MRTLKDIENLHCYDGENNYTSHGRNKAVLFDYDDVVEAIRKFNEWVDKSKILTQSSVKSKFVELFGDKK